MPNPAGQSDVPEPHPGAQESDITVFGLAATLLRRRWLIASVTLAFMLVALAVVLLRARTYTSSFSFYPEQAQDATTAGLAGLVGQFGLTLGAGASQAQSPQMYADLLKTRGVLTPIALDSFTLGADAAAPVPLPEALDIGEQDAAIRLEETLEALRDEVISTTVATRTTGVVTVRVQTESRPLSLAIAQRLVDGLNRFNLETRQSQAREERQFAEERLKAARRSLETAGDSLERFLRANRAFANSPRLEFEHDRLQHEVTLQQQLVTGLAQQFEEARIREVRDIPVITLVEQPTAPARPDPRGGTVALAAAMLLGFFFSGAWAILADEVTRLRASRQSAGLEELREEWGRVRRARV